MLWRLLLTSLFPLLAGQTGTIKGHITLKRVDGSDKKDYSEVVVFVADFPRHRPTPRPRSASAEKSLFRACWWSRRDRGGLPQRR